MGSLNKIHLIGRLGNDPKTHIFNNGNKKTTISIATSEKWKDKDGNPQEKTQWHNVGFYNKIAEIAEKYLKKGMEVYIEGTVEYNQSEKDGVKTYFTEVKALGMQMLGAKKDNEGTSSQPNNNSTYETVDASTGEVDTLPF